MNPKIFGAAPLPPQEAGKSAAIPRQRRKRPNKTEQAYGAILAARVARGEIVAFEFEAMTLRWGDVHLMQYTPDFTVTELVLPPPDGNSKPLVRLRFIEVKGGHKWPKDIVKFKEAANHFPHYGFEMWECKAGEWRQVF